jgi:hypothetical protein
VIDEEKRRKLEDVLDAVDRARTKLEVAGLQLAGMGLKDIEAVETLRKASILIREARGSLLFLRTA